MKKVDTTRSGGFTLVEVMVSLGIFLIISLAVSYLLSSFYLQRYLLQVKSNAGLMRLQVNNAFHNSTALQNTMNDPVNSSMGCITSGGCAAGNLPLRLVGVDGQVIYDSTSPTSGLTADGMFCNTYSAMGGNDQCPVHIDLRWSPICSSYPCQPTQIHITGTFSYNPSSLDKKMNWNTDSYRIDIIINMPTIVPTIVISGVAGGTSQTCAIINGGVKCWGLDFAGQLGDGQSVWWNLSPQPATGLASGVTAISSGRNHSCAIKGGAAYCWGINNAGQIGNGTNIDAHVPALVTGLGSLVTAISAHENSSCAVFNGGVKCWGDNNYGQLGDGTSNSRNLPVQVTGLTANATDVSVGQSASCAVVNGGAKCWGNNFYNVLNNGTGIPAGPVQGPMDVVGFTTGVTKIQTKWSTTCVLKAGGLWCWGLSDTGQVGSSSVPLGVGSFTATPTQVDGLNFGVSDFSHAGPFACAIQNGGMKCWGNGQYGNVGDGTSGNYNSPRVPTGMSSGVLMITAGQVHACALVGTVLSCWGDNGYGQLGTNATMNLPTSTPLPVQGL